MNIIKKIKSKVISGGHDEIGRHKLIVSYVRNDIVKWCKFRESLTDNADANPERSLLFNRNVQRL